MNHPNRRNLKATVVGPLPVPRGVTLSWWRWEGEACLLARAVPSGIAEVSIANFSIV